MSRKRHKKKNKENGAAGEDETPSVPTSEASPPDSHDEPEAKVHAALEQEAATAVDDHPARREGGDEPDETGLDAETAYEEEMSVESLRAELERLVREVAELKELAQRKQAEFENYRRRTERERSDFLRHAAAETILEILPVFDNLGRAVEVAEAGGADEATSGDQLREGIGIIYKQFKDILERNGLEEIECEGKPFDPHVHEAVSRVETNEHPDGTVVEVFQKGYRLKDRLLRPSMVSVARGGDSDAESGSDDRSEEDEVVRQSE